MLVYTCYLLLISAYQTHQRDIDTIDPLLIKQSNRSNRTPTPSPQLQRESNKGESTFADNTIQIVKSFHMCHLPLAADIVRMEVHLAFRARTNRFDTCAN